MMFLFIFNHQEYLNIKNRIKLIETANNAEMKQRRLKASAPAGSEPKYSNVATAKVMQFKPDDVPDKDYYIKPISIVPLANERFKERFAIERGYEVIKIETESAETITIIGKHNENRK